MFWYYNSYYEQVMPTYDTSGIAFAWGGRITGATSYMDMLSAPFDFTVAFTNLLGVPYPNVYAQLTLGFRTDAYTPGQYNSIPQNGGGGSSTSTYLDGYTTAGSYHETGNLSLNLTDTDAGTDLYWYAVLRVDWNHEMVSPSYWSGSYYTLNGDTLTVTVPDHSIDVTYVPESTPGVPDSGSSIALLGLTMMGLVCLHRRR
jgi:hypothetical protein